MLKKPTLFILCGLPFSGKTTLAKELVKRFGFVRIDLDQINAERRLGSKSNDEISAEDWKITYDESYKRVDMALAQGQTVINDTANFTREQRDKLRKIANNHNIKTKIIYVNVPVKLACKRWQDNRNTKVRYDVRDEDFAEVADNFQAPTTGENVIYYDQTMTLDEWIKKYF